MSILKYFKPIKKGKELALPDPNGLLSEQVPSSSIEAANNKVSEIITNRLETLSESEIFPS